MMKFFLVLLSSVSLVTVHGQGVDCGSGSGSFSVAVNGATSAANKLIEGYKSECSSQGSIITVVDATTVNSDYYYDDGSTVSAGFVCENFLAESIQTDTTSSINIDVVDIGGMSRKLITSLDDGGNNNNVVEGTVIDDHYHWIYECEGSPQQRNVIEVDIAHEGIAVGIKIDGVAADCIIDILENSLSLNQLRWIFSNYDEMDMEADGIDLASVIPNSDNDPSTKLWNELDESCASEPIVVANPSSTTSSSSVLNADFFAERIFSGLNETFGGTAFDTQAELANFLLTNDEGAGITFFGLPYILQELNQEMVHLISIKNDDGVDGEEPSSITTYKDNDNTYPLTRKLYMNVYQDESSLENTRPFLEYVFTKTHGDDILKTNGYWPLDEWEKVLMATRLQLLSSTAGGIALDDIQKSCPPAAEDGTTSSSLVTIAGSSTVFPVAQLWSEIYSVGCEINFDVNGGGSSVGAGRVCGNLDLGEPVDIGNMSREWKVGSESNLVSLKKEFAIEENNGGDFLYQCLQPPGDETRSAIQIDVAIDGLTVAVQEGGAAYQCIQLLGGLTVDQLRWIYSNYNDRDLVDSGWDQDSSLRNSDFNSQTHLWSELDSRCEHIEIRIAGADSLSGTYEYFLETVLTDFDNGETFDVDRPGFGYENSEDDERLVAYLQEFGEAISYFGYSYYYENSGSLSAVPVQNDAGDYVLPDPTTIGDGTYNPLARRIYMNLLNDEETLKNTVPFVKFGLQHPELVTHTGYVAIPESDIEIMMARLDDAPFNPNSGGMSTTLSRYSMFGCGVLVLTTIVGIVGF